MKVLYLGPTNFNPGIWTTLAKYVFGDLFRAIYPECRIFLISHPMPPHALEGRRFLKNNFDVTFYEIPRNLSHEEKILQIAALAKHIGPDVITNVFDGGTIWGHAAAVVAELLGTRSVVRVSGDEITSFLAQGFFDKGSPEHLEKLHLQQESFQKAGTIITMSPWEQNRVQSFLMAKDKVKVCPRGVDLNKFTCKPRTRTLGQHFCFIGRNSIEKGYFLLDQVADEIYKHQPSLKFFFVGNFNPQRINNKIYTGYISSEKLNSVYDLIDILVLPSLTEGLPQVVCEAMAKGIPCILTKHIFQNFLKHKETAFLVDFNFEHLHKMISDIPNDIESLQNVSHQSHLFAARNFDKSFWSKIYKNFIMNQ
jgi:glycosyltransferase involved in cell wall biosynthesis